MNEAFFSTHVLVSPGTVILIGFICIWLFQQFPFIYLHNLTYHGLKKRSITLAAQAEIVIISGTLSSILSSNQNQIVPTYSSIDKELYVDYNVPQLTGHEIKSMAYT